MEQLSPDDGARVQERMMVRNPIAKFAIGVFAVMAAAVIPRLAAALGTPSQVVLPGLTGGYLIVSGLFAGIVGITLMILEWWVPKTPRDSLMVALGVPAVLVGAFNTTVLTRQMDSLGQTQTASYQSGAQGIHVPVDESPDKPIELLSPKAAGGSSGFLDLFSPRRASAHESARPIETLYLVQRPNVGIDYTLPRYYVVLDRAASQKDAEEAAARLRKEFPEAAAVKQGTQFLIVESPQPKLTSEALGVVSRAKQRNLRPELIRARDSQ